MHTLMSTPLTPDLLRGALQVEETGRGLRPHRLPAWAREHHADAQMLQAQSQPSGVHLALRTRARVIELDAVATRRVYIGAPERPAGVYEAQVGHRVVASGSVEGGDQVRVDLSTGSVEHVAGPVGTVRLADLGEGDKDVRIWLPHNEGSELVGLRSDAPVAPWQQQGRRVWLHHGSSISQGSNAERPTQVWPVRAASRAGLDLVNMGFSASALVDPFVARAISEVPADLISLKLGINVVNADLMRERAFAPAVHGFLDTVRRGHPHTPVVLISPLFCPIHEHTPGPAAFDTEALARGQVRFCATGDPAEVAAGRLTLQVLRRELARVVAERSQWDGQLSYVDGCGLYGPQDHERWPLPDRLHPCGQAHRLIGDRFAERVLTDQGPFAAG